MANDNQEPGSTVRFTCANWTGDTYTGHHTGPCGSRGYLDVPAIEINNGTWRRWVINSANTNGEGWSVTVHWCRDAGDHDVNAGSRFHGNEHEMLFCCGPCTLAYLLGMYFDPLQVNLIIEDVKIIEDVRHELRRTH